MLTDVPVPSFGSSQFLILFNIMLIQSAIQEIMALNIKLLQYTPPLQQ